MKTRGIIAVLGMGVVLALGACSKNDNDSMNNADREFMDRMAYTHNSAVQLGNLAASDGSDASIKSFGLTVSSAHSTAMDELKTLAKQRNYNLPSNPDAEHLGLKVLLEAESGRQFDSIYIKGQVKDHNQSLQIIDDELSKGKDQALKNYASKHRPMEVSHKSTAEGIVMAKGF